MKKIGWLMVSVLFFQLAHGGVSDSEQAIAEASVNEGFLSGITVVNHGAGYVSEPTVAIIGGGGTGAVAKAVITNGRVSAVVVLSAGSGYLGVPKIVISPPSKIIFKFEPQLFVYGQEGVGVSIEKVSDLSESWVGFSNAVIASGGVVTFYLGSQFESSFYRVSNNSVVATNSYPNNPSNVGNAIASAMVVAGFVTRINLVSGGSGYVNEPKVNLIGGGGTGATAKAFLNGDKVSSIVVLTAGAGYSAPPDVIIDSPPFKTRIEIKIAPRLELAGQPWSRARVEQSLSKNGPWVFSTNSAIPPSGVVSLDLKPGIDNLFFKVSEVVPPGITGFVWINPGSFLMGSPETEVGRNNLSKWEEIQHQVTVSRGFWISDHEVTQSEYGAVTGDYTRQTDFDSPVVGVSWYDAVNYCSKLTDRERGAGRISYQQIYRLPTEAEWEYVCRAGTSGARYGVLNDIAWSRVSASMPPYKVRLKLPNSWGVYDTLGNVWEWCSDWSSDYPSYAVNE